MRQEAAQEKDRRKEDEVTRKKWSREEDNLRRSEEKKQEARHEMSRPISSPPAGARVDLQGEWTLREGKIIRRLRRPRRELFYPAGGGCPVDWRKLKGKRVTHVIMANTGEILDYLDDWTADDAGGPSGTP